MHVVPVSKGQRTLLKLVLLHKPKDPRDQTQVIRFSGKCLPAAPTPGETPTPKAFPQIRNRIFIYIDRRLSYSSLSPDLCHMATSSYKATLLKLLT